MLHFLQTVSGDFCLKITDANAARIFALMRKELPSLERADIVFGAGAASMIATQMRSLSWRLQASGHGDSPKTPKPGGQRRRQAVHLDSYDPKILALPTVMAHWREHLGLETKWRSAPVVSPTGEEGEILAGAIQLGAA